MAPAQGTAPAPDLQLPGGTTWKQAEKYGLLCGSILGHAGTHPPQKHSTRVMCNAKPTHTTPKACLPPNPTSPAPSPNFLPSPKDRDQWEGQQAEGKSPEHPKPAGTGGSLQNWGGFWWKGATGDEQEAVVGTELKVAEAKGCPGDPLWGGERDREAEPSAVTGSVSLGASHWCSTSAAEPSLWPRTGQLLLCPPFSHPYKKTRLQRGNGEEEWPVAALPSPHGVGRLTVAGFLSLLLLKALLSGCRQTASCEETRILGGRSGTGLGQRDELIIHAALKTLGLGKTSPPYGV